MTVCQNCETAFKGKYCSECGQKAGVKRITWRSIFSDLVKKVTFWDKGLLFTTLHVLKHPGKMARDYIAGKRVNYNKPLNYILLVVAASVLVFPKKEFENALSSINDKSRPNSSVMEWVFSNISIIYLMLIPFLAMVSKWFNRKTDVNFPELFVFYCYLMAGSTLVSIPFTVIGNIFHLDAISASPLGIIQYSAWILFFAWGYVQFFGKQRSYWGGIQGAFVLLISYFLYIIIFSILFAIVIVAAKFLLGIELITLPKPNTVSPTQ